MGDALEITKVLVEPTNKLIDAVTSAIGIAYEPRRIRKKAEAKAYEITVVSEAIRESSDIPALYNNGTIQLDNTELTQFLVRTENRILAQEMRRQYNLETVLDYAYDELDGSEPVSNDCVDPDWITRFLNYATDISNEQMQIVWGKILAGQIQVPGKFSLRTLETLRNMSQKEAQAFQEIIPYVICFGNDLCCISCNQSVKEKYKILDGHLIQLDACGIIHMIPGTSLPNSIEPNGRENAIYTKERLLSVINNSPIVENLRVDEIYLLTSAGKELFELLECSSNNDYFETWAELLYNKNKKTGLRFEILERVDDPTQKAYKAEAIKTLK